MATVRPHYLSWLVAAGAMAAVGWLLLTIPPVGLLLWLAALATIAVVAVRSRSWRAAAFGLVLAAGFVSATWVAVNLGATAERGFEDRDAPVGPVTPRAR